MTLIFLGNVIQFAAEDAKMAFALLLRPAHAIRISRRILMDNALPHVPMVGHLIEFLISFIMDIKIMLQVVRMEFVMLTILAVVMRDLN